MNKSPMEIRCEEMASKDYFNEPVFIEWCIREKTQLFYPMHYGDLTTVVGAMIRRAHLRGLKAALDLPEVKQLVDSLKQIAGQHETFICDDELDCKMTAEEALKSWQSFISGGDGNG